MMPFIQNVSMEHIKIGRHMDVGNNSMLIQIVDMHMDFPKPKVSFSKVLQFKFRDWENERHPQTISDEQAKKIVDALNYALDHRMQTVVHCVMGISRSGAVAEFGMMIGFRDAGAHRIPNVLVKRKLMKAAGIGYA